MTNLSLKQNLMFRHKIKPLSYSFNKILIGSINIHGFKLCSLFNDTIICMCNELARVGVMHIFT